MPAIASVQLKVGLEVHVELATRTKLFSAVPSIAHPDHFDAPPNSLIDPVTLALPGALPVMNAAAVEMAMLVGLALGCSIAPLTRWDRKGYFYPDMPKGYQISQYPLPLCFDGAVDLPAIDDRGEADYTETGRRIGIIRAHLEEDAGKLLHEAPGGGAIDFSIVDLNRAGTPLLEIVTQPDFESADEVVVFAQMLRNTCRFLGVTEGIMQRGHMRFEPNINCLITLDDGRLVKTPIVEIKNLNSFKSLRGAIEFELADQPRRWQQDGREMGPGAKVTRGWDDHALRTVVQREKEDAHDYRYFPEPDLPPLRVSEEWVERVRGRLPELPRTRLRRYVSEYGLKAKEAAVLVEERAVAEFYEACIEEAVEGAGVGGLERSAAGRLAANMLLQSGLKRANERSAGGGEAVLVSDLGLTPRQVAQILGLREAGKIGANAADELFGVLCEAGDGADAEEVASSRGMLIVRDDAALERWCEQAIAENAAAAADVRAGKMQAVGRLVGAVMKLAGGAADAKSVREALVKKLGG